MNINVLELIGQALLWTWAIEIFVFLVLYLIELIERE